MPDVVPDEILVKFREPIGLNRFQADSESGMPGRSIGSGIRVLKLENDNAFQGVGSASTAIQRERLQRTLVAWRSDPRVEYAEPNYHGSFADMPPLAGIPNDPGSPAQWWLKAINARAAWSIATGAGITIAVIDSGVDLTHEDLTGNLSANGYNFGDPGLPPQDRLGHGTAVAGIVAAKNNNAFAGSGLAPEAKILPIKINPGAVDDFDSAAVAQAIDYAVAQKVRVINLSFKITRNTRMVESALDRALAAGVIVVAAAGNKSGEVAFPASYPGVIAVAGSDMNGQLVGDFGYGPGVVAAAPAMSIQSTLLGNGFGWAGNGTSYAAPMVAGLVAGMLQLRPKLERQTIIDLLRSNTQPFVRPQFAFGVIDAGKTLQALLPDTFSQGRVFLSNDLFSLGYRLPPTAGPVDIYVAVETPVGEFWLNTDGVGAYFVPPDIGQLQPLARDYQSPAGEAGMLFGGIFPSLSLVGLPSGEYSWTVFLHDALTRKLIGPPSRTSFNLQSAN